MKVLFHLGHPAHYHLFKNTIKILNDHGHTTLILIKKKDVLEELLDSDSMPYLSLLPKGRSDTKMGILLGLIKADFKMLVYCIKNRPDLMVGTSIVNSHVGKVLNIPVINVNEDDANIVPLYAKLSYPWSNVILSPSSCNNGKWDYKTIHYNGYHELAYLHPENFTPELNNVKKYIDPSKPYFILRFAKLTAHHDKEISGFENTLIDNLINILKPFGKIIINSEKPLDKKFENYVIPIQAEDMHHLLAFAKLFIGDSQTMAAEAAVLGTPFIRYNDFVGKIGYLNELERIYKLGYGFNTSKPNEMLNKVQMLLQNNNIKTVWEIKRNKMISMNINVNKFLTGYIESFPEYNRST